MRSERRKIIITGGTGFIGGNLTASLLERGYQVTILSRHARKIPFKYQGQKVSVFLIDLVEQKPPAALFQDVYAIIHLAGEKIYGWWSKEKKKLIYESRVLSTRNLINSIQNVKRKPHVFISASAVGYYGNREGEELDETSPPGNDFLARLCVNWEQEAKKGDSLGLRTVQVRTSPVLGHGGFLQKLLPLYKLGLGFIIGSGKQYFPWIHIQDIVRVYLYALESNIHGPINASAPEYITYKEFSDILAKTVKRPAFLRMPTWIIRAISHDLADALSTSQKVYPKKLQDAGFTFLFPKIKEALQDI